MITDRQKQFRQQYRSRIMGFYDGYLRDVTAMAAETWALDLSATGP